MSGNIRAFIAVDIPDSFKEELQCLLESFKRHGTDVRWAAAKNLHLTLKFLGDTSPDQVEKVKNILKELCSGQKVFFAHSAGLGGFPSLERPRLLWAGMDEGENDLKELAWKVEKGIRTLGFPVEERPFSAHLTLGRVRGPQNLRRLTEDMRTRRFVSAHRIEVNHLTFYKSTLTPEGSIYEPIEVVNFKF